MSQITNEDREAVRDGLSRLLSTEAEEDKLRRAMDGEHGYSPVIWQQMAEMGLLGIAVAEEAGGIGGGAIDVAMVMEEVGQRLVPLPYISTCVVGAELLQAAANGSSASLLAGVISGDAILAIGGAGDIVPLEDVSHSLVLSGSGSTQVISGEVSLVLHGAVATHYLIGLRDGADQIVLIVEAGQGVNIQPQTANDPALRPAKLTFDNAKAQSLEELSLGKIESARLRGVAALAAEQAGAARAIFDITIEYLQTRYQFGRAIGSFQALKHMAADLLVEVESATSSARAAALAIDAGSETAARSVALAGFICADAFREVSAQAIQMHGGIAYTREHVAHLYWRRARAMLPMFEDSNTHRERFLSSWGAAA